MKAQNPDSIAPVGHIYDYEVEGSGGPWVIDSCISPVIESISTVILENGDVVVEIIFSDENPIPSGDIIVSGFKLTETFYQNSTNSFVWSGTPPTEEDVINFIYVDPCTDSYYEGSVSTDCNRYGTTSGISLQFFTDYQNWRANPENMPLHEFLNSLSYLTPIQRWSFYQSTILDCDPIEVVTEIIPDGAGPNSGLCNCDLISLDWVMSPGSAPALGNANPSVDGEVSSINEYERVNESGANRYTYYHEIGAGATKHASLRYKDLYGDGVMRNRTFGYATDSGNPRRTRSLITLQCMNGEGFPEACGCSKPIEIQYEYGASLYTRAELRPSLFGRKKASGAATIDMATMSYTFEGQDEVLLNASNYSQAAECEMEINDEFIENYYEAMIAWVTLGLVASDSTQSITQNGDTLITAAGNSLAELWNTDFNISTPCEAFSESHGFTGNVNLEIEPNKTLELTMRSTEHLEVWGRRSHDSKSQVTSAHTIAYYITSQEGNTPDWCCSDHAGSYIATSLEDDFPQESLHDAVAGLFSSNAGGLPNLDSFSDYGVRVKSNQSNDDCADIIIQSLVLHNGPAVKKQVIAVSGKTILDIEPNQSVQSYNLPDGAYYLLHLSETGSILDTRPLQVFDNQVQTNEWYENE